MRELLGFAYPVSECLPDFLDTQEAASPKAPMKNEHTFQSKITPIHSPSQPASPIIAHSVPSVLHSPKQQPAPQPVNCQPELPISPKGQTSYHKESPEVFGDLAETTHPKPILQADCISGSKCNSGTTVLKLAF